ncbi:MAG: carbohydrate kinase family protein [Deltaproteobacteria bacterium]|jgi:adenosine kinase|nr:carbohydrate kinase family protein [Deltaproteobacteria bacterium]
MTIIVSGSLAFDRLAEYGGMFTDLILPEQLNILNVCFLVDKVERFHGGTAGNIAYNLALLGESPFVVSSVGDDPDGKDYLAKLKEWGLDPSGIKTDPERATAGAYIATDRAERQLIFFNPGAMQGETALGWEDLPKGPSGEVLGIVSPGGFSDMKIMSSMYRDNNAPFIFDPGQQVPAFTGEELLGMLDGASLLVVNEYELKLFLEKMALPADGLFRYAQAVLVTLGEKGSRLDTPRGSQHVLPVRAGSVVNPTGAGDAYRAGLLKGLKSKLPVLSACRLGSAVASFCVEAPGTQEHRFTLDEALDRVRRTFKEDLKI